MVLLKVYSVQTGTSRILWTQYVRCGLKRSENTSVTFIVGHGEGNIENKKNITSRLAFSARFVDTLAYYTANVFYFFFFFIYRNVKFTANPWYILSVSYRFAYVTTSNRAHAFYWTTELKWKEKRNFGNTVVYRNKKNDLTEWRTVTFVIFQRVTIQNVFSMIRQYCDDQWEPADVCAYNIILYNMSNRCDPVLLVSRTAFSERKNRECRMSRLVLSVRYSSEHPTDI